MSAPVLAALSALLTAAACWEALYALEGGGMRRAAGWFLGTARAAAVRALLERRRSRRRAEIAAGAPVAARALADALSGGHSVRGAIVVAGAADRVPGAAGEELAATSAGLALGDATDTALMRLRDRAGDPAWNTIVAAILLQRDAGGDLATLLRGIATGLDDARRVAADARTQTAQARFTARIVVLLPLAGAGLGELAAPGSLARIAAEPLSLMLAACALCLGTGASIAIARIARSPA